MLQLVLEMAFLIGITRKKKGKKKKEKVVGIEL
jgi:hypothetical protein